MIEALEVRIEEAWCELCAYAKPSTVRTLWLTPSLKIFGFRPNTPPPRGSHEIGSYNRTIDLQEFREDVFHVYRSMQRSA